MKKLCGSYNLNTHKLINNSENIYSYEDSLIHIEILGNIVINSTINNSNLIKNYYINYKSILTQFISGMYLMLIYDKTNESLLIFQDKMTSPLPLYYCINNSSLYYSTSLKDLLLISKINRKINNNKIKEFAINGYIYGKETLIEAIYKIKPFSALYVNKNKIAQIPVTYPVKKISEQDGINNWTNVLQNAIKECCKNQSEINIPLSNGYDSNFILYTIRQETNKHVNAFSVGGKFGKNELPQVRENVKLYKNVTLNTTLTNNETLNNLCDIVWILEGNVYEVGLFLQYELANLCNNNNVKTLICGECADQVMNINFNKKSSLFPKKKSTKVFRYILQQHPYIFASQMILKKNGIMFNSYDIETKYPYLNTDFMNVADAVKNLNGTSKSFHEKICTKSFPAKIIENIAKVGGSTDCHSLFENNSDIIKFLKRIEKTDFYKKNIKLMKEINKENNKFFIKKAKNKFIKIISDKKFFLTSNNKSMAKHNNSNTNDSKSLLGKYKYYKCEMKLQQYLCYLYIIIFNELFISGKYDCQFKNAGINLKLNDFFK